MAQMAVIEAVEGRLADLWSACPVVGVLTPSARPADGAPFLAVQYPLANSEQATLGSHSVYRDEGVFRILIHQTKSESALAFAWADAIKAVFRGRDFGGVRCMAPSGAALDDLNDQGLYFRVSVAVPYWFDLEVAL